MHPGRWSVPFLAVTSLTACGGRVQVEGSDGGAEAAALPACPVGGPEGEAPLLVGPTPAGATALWRNLREGAGEGEALIVPRAGVIDQVVVQMFADPGVGGCLTRLYRYCEGERVLVASAETPGTAFPVYVLSVDPDATIVDQDLRTTSIDIDPPLAVAAGERVDVIFAALDTEPGHALVSVITGDVAPDAWAVFPDGAPGIGVQEKPEWDYVAQVRLR